MSGHEHGSMNISEHERGFAGFVKFTVWVCVVIIFALIFLAVFNS